MILCPEVESLTQSTAHYTDISPENRLSRNIIVPFVAISSVIIFAVIGFFGLSVAFPDGMNFELQKIDVYAGCELPVEYIMRAAALCQPVFWLIGLLFVSGYVMFENFFIGAFFAIQGAAFGIVLRLSSFSDPKTSLHWIALHTLLILIFVAFTAVCRTSKGALPPQDAFIYSLITAGIASMILVIASIL